MKHPKTNSGNYPPPYTARIQDSDGMPCPYCGRVMSLSTPKLSPTRDHVVPRKTRRQGMQASGILVCCKDCNSAKGHMAISEWLQHNEDILVSLRSKLLLAELRAAHLKYLTSMGLK